MVGEISDPCYYWRAILLWGQSFSHQFLNVLPCIETTTDLTWDLPVLDFIRDKYVTLVKQNVFSP
jgi:hypothetical protein